jgi:hypothetical protein
MQKWVDEVEQEGWAWCSLCEQLAFHKERTVCAIGVPHDFSSSGSYMLRWEIGGHADKGRLQLRRSLQPDEVFVSPAGDFTVRVLKFEEQASRAFIELTIS